MAKKTVSYITAFGTLRYPKISEPDTKGEYADNKFKTDIVFDDAGFEAYKAAAEAAAAELLPSVKNVKMPVYTEWQEGKGGRAKSQRRPVVLDAKNNPLPEGKKIGGGTVARLAVAFASYPPTNPKGICVYLNKVQIKELVEYGNSQDFDEVEGFVNDETENPELEKDEGFDSL